MRLYQRFLYVGLGGTGLRIGSYLEQQLRLEMCGADGRALCDNPAFEGTLAPHELPQFVQFLYADFDEAERSATAAASGGGARESAAMKTATFIDKLIPEASSYQTAAQNLRTSCYPMVKDWLPGSQNEPLVSPLSDGAGQFPSVGRTALFETLHSRGFRVISDPLDRVVGSLARAGGQLDSYLGRKARDGCDVFVGFSVAGGTGCGIFYDFLRFVSWKVGATFGGLAQGSGIHVYPLVVLPSAFPQERGGGREAQLNGGPALRELFALVDRCNTGVPNPHIDYPDQPPGGIPEAVPARTAFVFRRPTAIDLSDLHRSVVAFVTSLVGTEAQSAETRSFTSFASVFVDSAGKVRDKARDGIGCHPATAALAAQLSIPLEEITDIVSARLVAQAISDLETPRPSEDNHKGIESFLAAAGLTPLWLRAASDDLSPLPPDLDGAKAISEALRARRAQAAQTIRALDETLTAQVAQMVDRMDLGAATSALAERNDVFRVARIVLGDQRLADTPVSSEGIIGFFERRSLPVKDGEGQAPGAQPPNLPALEDHGPVHMFKLHANDAAVLKAVSDQDEWYRLRVQQSWHTAWNQQTQERKPKVDALRENLVQLRDALLAHARKEPDEFRASCRQLYGAKQGIVYFMPDGGPANDLDHFYSTRVLPGLRDALGFPDDAPVGAILSRIVGDRWVAAYREGAQAPEHAVSMLLDLVGARIGSLLGSKDHEPHLPELSELLEAAARGNDDPADADHALAQRFRASLGSLLPAGFEPEGSGPLQVEVFYPTVADASRVEAFLDQVFGSRGNLSFNQVADAGFLGVVLMRTTISATEIQEYRSLMLLWAEASNTPQQADYLPWRQPIGLAPKPIVLTDSDEADVLIALLNALWDGSVTLVDGDADSPRRIAIRQYEGPEETAIELSLTPFGRLSSWTSVTRSYERFALDGDSTRSQACAQFLNRRVPNAQGPSDLYKTFRGLVEGQRKSAQQEVDKASNVGRPIQERGLHFWQKTVGAALERDLSLQGATNPQGGTHADMYQPSAEPAAT